MSTTTTSTTKGTSILTAKTASKPGNTRLVYKVLVPELAPSVVVESFPLFATPLSETPPTSKAEILAQLSEDEIELR